MTDWKVTVVTQSGYIQSVRVNDCITREDASAAALGMTGASRIIVCNPQNYDDSDNSNIPNKSNQTYEQIASQLNDIQLAQERQEQRDYQRELDEGQSELDTLEEEIFDLECRIAMEEGAEMPSVEDFRRRYPPIGLNTSSTENLKDQMSVIIGLAILFLIILGFIINPVTGFIAGACAAAYFKQYLKL